MPGGKRSWLVAIGIAIVVAVVAGAAVWFLLGDEEKEKPSAYPLDGSLRLNQVQVLATHNSYHIQQDVPIPASQTTQYTHALLDQQLESQGVRGFELDVVNVPDGQFPVLHTPVVDATSNCTPLSQCLEIVRQWSRAHSGHVPIFILVEPKEGGVEQLLDPRLRPFDAAGLDQLDAQVRSSLGRQLVTPDSVRGGSQTLRDAVVQRGWPSLRQTRGKVMVILNAGGATRDTFLQAHPSLQGRAMFVTAAERSPAAAVIKVDDPDEARIQGLVKEGFIVRTRADADLVEARAQDVTRRDLALRTGAQIISTDFPVSVPPIGGDYVVQLPAGTPARCNPVDAPKKCRSPDVENPRHLVPLP
jgi:Phosphoinositide phospholipase C, Ca2+-dependent